MRGGLLSIRSGVRPVIGRPGWPVVMLALVMVVLLVGLGVGLTRQVQEELDRLGTSRTDNAYWTLTQMEVEFLELATTVSRARSAVSTIEATPGDDLLRGLRQNFDLVFSRMVTLDESPFYRAALVEAGSAAPADRLSVALRGLAPRIDGSDADLRAALPEIDAVLTDLRPEVRTMAVDANLLLAQSSAAGRAQVSGTLRWLALVALALMAVLTALAVGFFRLSQVARARARDVRLTSLRLATIIEAAPDALIVTDGAGRIEQANPAAAQLLGRAQGDLAGRDIGSLLVHRDSGLALHLPQPGQGPQRIAVTALCGDGRSLPAELALTRADTGAMRPGDAGGLWADPLSQAVPAHPDAAGLAVLFLRDTSDRVATEDMLRRARDQAMAGERAKDHFIAVMSHEMRTPLNAILGLSELLADAALPAPQQAQVALLDRSGRVLLQHVNDVLDIARLEAQGANLVAHPFDLAALLGDLVAGLEPAAAARGNVLRIAGALPTGLFQGDAARLRQVVANLLTNAVKYTRDGTVTLTVAQAVAPETPPDAAVPAGQPMVVLEVSDTGIGIPQDRARDVFADFVRLDTPGLIEEGTGLGLGIVRRLVAAMGGDLGFDSVEGHGTRFWVRLPLERAAAADGSAATHTGLQVSPPGQILVAEDHPVNRQVLRQLLERDGHAVTEAVDGAAALALAGETGFDAILMDIGMPGLDGLAATAAIRGGPGPSRKTRIVAVTAHAFPEDRDRFLAAGFDGVIVKPVSLQALRQALAGMTPLVTDPKPDLGGDQGVPSLFAALEAAVGPAMATRALQGLVADAAGLARDIAAGQVTADALHRMAGLAGTCGATRLAGLSGQAERAVAAGAPWDPASLLAEIAAVTRQVATSMSDPASVQAGTAPKARRRVRRA